MRLLPSSVFNAPALSHRDHVQQYRRCVVHMWYGAGLRALSALGAPSSLGVGFHFAARHSLTLAYSPFGPSTNGNCAARVLLFVATGHCHSRWTVRRHRALPVSRDCSPPPGSATLARLFSAPRGAEAAGLQVGAQLCCRHTAHCGEQHWGIWSKIRNARRSICACVSCLVLRLSDAL